ncbi:hypothetical protein T492DRAFT_1021692 [Pavlovales sp. CCMP2436]|nr:hypothetical protein T492DRAFT_1021692 [Pavlovales sp. CCMP2436]
MPLRKINHCGKGVRAANSQFLIFEPCTHKNEAMRSNPINQRSSALRAVGHSQRKEGPRGPPHNDVARLSRSGLAPQSQRARASSPVSFAKDARLNGRPKLASARSRRSLRMRPLGGRTRVRVPAQARGGRTRRLCRRPPGPPGQSRGRDSLRASFEDCLHACCMHACTAAACMAPRGRRSWW